jgi:hypothetical protein
MSFDGLLVAVLNRGSPKKAYLVLCEQSVADARQQHHCDQERDEAFGRHDGGICCEVSWFREVTAILAGTYHSPSRVEGLREEVESVSAIRYVQ